MWLQVEGVQYNSSRNMMRQRTYSVHSDVKWGYRFSPCVTRPQHSPDGRPMVTWSCFHKILPLAANSPDVSFRICFTKDVHATPCSPLPGLCITLYVLLMVYALLKEQCGHTSYLHARGLLRSHCRRGSLSWGRREIQWANQARPRGSDSSRR